MSKFSICFANKIHPIGGAGTFLKNFKIFLKKKNYSIIKIKEKKKIDYIFITGASFKNIVPIILNKICGTKIINRVDGKLWIYKYTKSGHSGYLVSIMQNFLIVFFKLLANKIIYQSKYIKRNWNMKIFNEKSVIIYNASKPNFKKRNFKKNIRPTLISVEGSIDGALNSNRLINSINENYIYEIYGDVSKNFKLQFQNKKKLKFFGKVSREQIKKILKKNKKYIFISLEMKAPCPNSVIEAINHGIPVIGYKQGSMREIIKKNQGELLKVDNDLKFKKSELLNAIKKINDNYEFYNKNLKNIDNKFKLNYMLNKYESEIANT